MTSSLSISNNVWLPKPPATFARMRLIEIISGSDRPVVDFYQLIGAMADLRRFQVPKKSLCLHPHNTQYVSAQNARLNCCALSPSIKAALSAPNGERCRDQFERVPDLGGLLVRIGRSTHTPRGGRAMPRCWASTCEWPVRPRCSRHTRILSDRENSSRVQDIVRIERSFERTHHFDFLPSPTHRQIRPLNYADAVFR